MWYAVQTKPGREEAVREKARKLFPKDTCGDCKVLYYVSKKRYLGQWHEEKEQLLPGYVFLTADEPAEMEEISDKIAEFTRVLGYGKTACPIRKEEEELLKRLAGEKDEIGMSYGIIEDGVLKIKDGVLAGLESSVRKIDRHKRKGYIGLSFEDGKEKLVGIGLEITEKS